MKLIHVLVFVGVLMMIAQAPHGPAYFTLNTNVPQCVWCSMLWHHLQMVWKMHLRGPVRAVGGGGSTPSAFGLFRPFPLEKTQPTATAALDLL